MSPLPRLMRAVTALAVAGLVLTGCSDSDTDSPREKGASDTQGQQGAFPLTLTHGQGKVTIPRKPERVVVLGFADAQIAAALGAPVVGGTRNTSSTDGNWLGVSPGFSSEVLTLDAINPNLEKILALKPDLILMTTAQPGYGSAYKKLSAIAPVVSYKNKLLQDSGDELTTLIGQALGEEKKAEQLIAKSHKSLADFAAAHPGLKGKGYAFGQEAGGTVHAVVAADGPTARFFGALGMKLPEPLVKLGIESGGKTQLSQENLDLLDNAQIAFFGVPDKKAGEAFAKRPVVSSLKLTTSGSLHFLDYNESGMLLGPNPAVTDMLLAKLGPALKKASA
ncbi:ABC transporter substrate-binding protein [Streptomyces sp. NPDC056500]|uniref:ABC transporter substrate-binding protein n=1 Tax=Streptomyces sp. NPDC056500 TaxID=3345840 RepID=UPI00367C2F31